MKKVLKSGIVKVIALTLVAALCLCSCGGAGKVADAANNLLNAVMSSVGGEISSAISEGMNEISDGLDEFSEGKKEYSDGINGLKEGLNDVSDAIGTAGSMVSERIESIGESVADEISSSLSDAADNITASTEDTTAAPSPVTGEKQYTFRNQKRFDEHYEKHGAEFGNITQDQYLELANELINSKSDRVLHKYSEDGDYMYFDQDTNYFLVLSEDGYIRTFFIPSAGIKYWNRQ